MYCFSVAKNL
jgi:hypothetical protein